MIKDTSIDTGICVSSYYMAFGTMALLIAVDLVSFEWKISVFIVVGESCTTKYSINHIHFNFCNMFLENKRASVENVQNEFKEYA